MAKEYGGYVSEQTSLHGFRLPRYEELPNFGLYLEQTITYINQVLEPLDRASITPSMLSNYVKQGYIDRPVKKQYFADQIGYLIFMTINKQVLTLEHIRELFELQKGAYPAQAAYDNFCERFERMLGYLLGDCDEPLLYPDDASFEQQVLQSVIVSTCHIIHLNWCLEHRRELGDGGAGSAAG